MTDDLVTFADVTFGNLTFAEMNAVHDSTPDESCFHVRLSINAGRYTVLVEDLSITAARDLFAALAEFRAAAVLDFPDVPDWRDIRTGTAKAWRGFADAHQIPYPADASRERIAAGVRSWLEKSR